MADSNDSLQTLQTEAATKPPQSASQNPEDATPPVSTAQPTSESFCSPTADPSMAKEISAWSLKRLDDGPAKSLRVCVQGNMAGRDGLWCSGMIYQCENRNLVHSIDNNLMYLVGRIDENEMHRQRFSALLTAAFCNGFPSNWKALLAEEYENSLYVPKPVQAPRGRGRPRKSLDAATTPKSAEKENSEQTPDSMRSPSKKATGKTPTPKKRSRIPKPKVVDDSPQKKALDSESESGTRETFSFENVIDPELVREFGQPQSETQSAKKRRGRPRKNPLPQSSDSEEVEIIDYALPLLQMKPIDFALDFYELIIDEEGSSEAKRAVKKFKGVYIFDANDRQEDDQILQVEPAQE